MKDTSSEWKEYVPEAEAAPSPFAGRKDDKVAPVGDIYTEPPRLGGLTAFGADVVKECNRLGIVVDLAHASHETVLGALKASTHPVIVSHTSLDTRTGRNARMAKMMAPRLISAGPAQRRSIAGNAGGRDRDAGQGRHPTSTIERSTSRTSWNKAMADAIGVDHVGIGTDTNILSSQANQSTNAAWPGLTGGFFKAAVAEMLRQNFTPCRDRRDEGPGSTGGDGEDARPSSEDSAGQNPRVSGLRPGSRSKGFAPEDQPRR